MTKRRHERLESAGPRVRVRLEAKTPIQAAVVCACLPALCLAQESLEEVVVTAQKREESVQKVPISMAVLSGQELDQSTAQGVAEILNTVPGVATLSSYQGGGTLVTIRGVSAGQALLNGASTTGYYLDSMPFGLVKQAIGPDLNAYDLQRVEVLRGPQGTLYGANALNGVVRVLTNDANLRELDVKARVSASSTDSAGQGLRGDAAINVPLIENKLAARAVVGYQEDDGWISSAAQKDFNDVQQLNLRLKVNAQPTDALSIALSLWRSRSNYGGPSIGEEERFSTSRYPMPIHNDYDTAGLKATYDFGRFSVASMTSYLEYHSDSNLDFEPFVATPSQLSTIFGSRVFSQEVVATSSGDGPWRWSIGDMYRRATEDLGQLIPEFAFGLQYNVESKSNAVYGELTRVLLDRKLELTAGLRYFHDSISQENQTGIGAPFIAAESTASATTPRAVVTWHPSDFTTVYASYSQGFRSGFPQNAPASAVAPAQPDRLENFEVGSKGSLLGGALKYEASVYHIKWEDVQQNLTVAVNGVPFSATVNGKSASGSGIDLALTAEPVDKLVLGASLSWNDLEMDDDVLSGGAVLFSQGGRLNFSPEYTAGVSADYSFPLSTGGLSGHVSAGANYVSEQSSRVLLGTTVSEGRGDSSLIPRASFSIESPQGWVGTLYGENLSNYQKSPIPGYGTLAMYDSRVRPRTIGLQFEYHYQ